MKQHFVLLCLIPFLLGNCVEKKPKEKSPTVDAVSAINTDSSSLENAKRATSSSIKDLSYPKENIFGTWASDAEGPHADFEINDRFFFVVDYDGNGEMPYMIERDSITVFYTDHIARGRINSAANDTLKIAWDNNEESNIYSRWKE